MTNNPLNHLGDPRDVMSTRMTVTVGPLAMQFSNQNLAMNLPTHFHQAHVFLEFAVDEEHGYPSFELTNDALRAELERVTDGVFRDATNEVVAARLFHHFLDFHDDSWEQYGGSYHLRALVLDVFGVHDAIGHDEGATRYRIEEA